ncbi:LuxR C-terminal-related transcriptional regulator [Chloroflexota bacterium]
MNTPLLTTKLYIPTPRASAVARPRLVERLAAGAERRLTLISAPAGFGKTTLAAEWAAISDLPLAWLSLEEADDQPQRFWAYLAAALQSLPDLHQAGVGMGLQAALRQPQGPSWQGLLAELVNEIAALPGRCALVLDDLQRVRDRQIHDGLIFLLQHLPPAPNGLHLIVISRVDPAWPLARWRASGELNELRAADLRFRPDEAAQFLRSSMGLDLQTEQITALEQRAEGWIAGLQMAAIAIRRREQSLGAKNVSAFIRQFSGSHHYVLDYLLEEVFEGQPPEIQNFLLQTSILERLSASLCDAILDFTIPNSSSQVILEHLETSNLFLAPLDAERRWYRYHHLFADLLRDRLAKAHPGLAESLHRRACDWHCQHGFLAEAVQHALAAGDHQRAAALLEGNALAMMDRGELGALLHWLDTLPVEMLRTRPWLNIAYAWFYLYNGQIQNTQPYLQTAAKGPAPLTTGEGRHINGHVATIRSYIASHAGQTKLSIKLARQALELLPESDASTRTFAGTLLGHKLRWSGDLAGAQSAYHQAIAISRQDENSHTAIIARGNLGELYMMLGQLQKAYKIFQEIQRLAERGRLPILGYIYSHIAFLLCEWNRLEKALDYATRGNRLSKAWGQMDILVNDHIWLALILKAIGDFSGALQSIHEARSLAGDLPWLARRAAAIEANLFLSQGDLQNASIWASTSGQTPDDELSFQAYPWQIVYARVLAAQGKLKQALHLIERLLNMAVEAGANGNSIEILVLQAMALKTKGEDQAAQAALERALALAEPAGYIRTFIREGAPMAGLLGRVIAGGEYTRYARQLLAALEHESPAASGAHAKGLAEALSPRELEVLRLLDTSLSSRQIAEQLVISVNTTRTHTRVIYEKLGVHKRMEAIERGRELGLL